MSNLYLALGDSITAGYGVGIKNSFASLYSTILSRHLPYIRYQNLGVNGLTTGGLADQLINGRGIRDFLTQARIMSITIGSNDLLSVGKLIVSNRQVNIDSILKNMSGNLLPIGKSVRSSAPSALVQVTTIYNPLPTGPDARLAGTAQIFIDHANQIITNWAESFGFQVILTDRLFRDKEAILIGPDHFHPNLRGHEVLAQAFAR